MHKTRKMKEVEDRFQNTLEEMLPDMITAEGLSLTAEAIGVSKATLGYWLLKLGIRTKRVALSPGESLKVERTV